MGAVVAIKAVEELRDRARFAIRGPLKTHTCFTCRSQEQHPVAGDLRTADQSTKNGCLASPGTADEDAEAMGRDSFQRLLLLLKRVDVSRVRQVNLGAGTADGLGEEVPPVRSHGWKLLRCTPQKDARQSHLGVRMVL
jgi:hypothetical protein